MSEKKRKVRRKRKPGTPLCAETPGLQPEGGPKR